MQFIERLKMAKQVKTQLITNSRHPLHISQWGRPRRAQRFGARVSWFSVRSKAAPELEIPYSLGL